MKDTHANLLSRYGLRMSLDELAELKRIDRRTALNQIYAGRFGIPVYKEGAEWWADTRSVAAYLDDKRAEAERSSQTELIRAGRSKLAYR
jgi:hypothetical protein